MPPPLVRLFRLFVEDLLLEVELEVVDELVIVWVTTVSPSLKPEVISVYESLAIPTTTVCFVGVPSFIKST